MLWPLPELDITGFTTQGSPTSATAAIASSRDFGEFVARGDEVELACGEFADAVAVHGQLDRFGRGRDAPAFLFQLCQSLGVDRLDFGDDHVGLVRLDRRPQRPAVEHREDLASIGDLHRRRILVAVAGDHPAAEPLGGDSEFPAEFARPQQHQCGDIHRRGDSGAA